jgi:hypothetical protein
MLIEGRHGRTCSGHPRLRDNTQKDQRKRREVRGSSPRTARSLCERLLHSVLRRPGGHSEEPIPDPIPNSAVKVLCADGTKPQGLEE